MSAEFVRAAAKAPFLPSNRFNLSYGGAVWRGTKASTPPNEPGLVRLLISSSPYPLPLPGSLASSGVDPQTCVCTALWDLTPQTCACTALWDLPPRLACVLLFGIWPPDLRGCGSLGYDPPDLRVCGTMASIPYPPLPTAPVAFSLYPWLVGLVNIRLVPILSSSWSFSVGEPILFAPAPSAVRAWYVFAPPKWWLFSKYLSKKHLGFLIPPKK